MYKVIGKERRTGVYEGRAYDNTILHTTYTKENAEDVEGECVATLKVKTAVCPAVHIGDSVDALYDKYGNIAHLSVTPAQK